MPFPARTRSLDARSVPLAHPLEQLVGRCGHGHPRGRSVQSGAAGRAHHRSRAGKNRTALAACCRGGRSDRNPARGESAAIGAAHRPRVRRGDSFSEFVAHRARGARARRAAHCRLSGTLAALVARSDTALHSRVRWTPGEQISASRRILRRAGAAGRTVLQTQDSPPGHETAHRCLPRRGIRSGQTLAGGKICRGDERSAGKHPGRVVHLRRGRGCARGGGDHRSVRLPGAQSGRQNHAR